MIEIPAEIFFIRTACALFTPPSPGAAACGAEPATADMDQLKRICPWRLHVGLGWGQAR